MVSWFLWNGVPEGETLRLETPTPLLDMDVRVSDGGEYSYSRSSDVGAGYDIFTDGRRFLMVRMPETPSLKIVLVQNFCEEL